MRIFRITSDIFTLCFIFAPPLFGSSSRFTAFPLAASVRTLGIVVRDVHNLRKVSLLINCRVNNAPPHGMHTFARVRVARPSFSLSLSLSLSLSPQIVLHASLFFQANRTSFAFTYSLLAREKARPQRMCNASRYRT